MYIFCPNGGKAIELNNQFRENRHNKVKQKVAAEIWI